MPSKESKSKTKTKKPVVKEDPKDLVRVDYVCRECRHKESSKIEIGWCINGLLGLKARRCKACKKWGTYLAYATIDNKNIQWAIYQSFFIKDKEKYITIDESTNSDNKTKKLIYKNIPKKDIDEKNPYIGINNMKNAGEPQEGTVDSNMKPIEIKWSSEFKKKYHKYFML